MIRNKIMIVILILLMFAAFSPAQQGSALAAVTDQKMAVPSYFYPGSYWPRLENNAATVGLAIINPDSGPGTSRDQEYADETERAQAQGIVVIGYVYTNYGARAASAVKADVNKYYQWYGVDGIFFDEASNTCLKKKYYLNLYNFVKAKGGAGKVVINPGINTPECYIHTADIIVNFEDSYSAYVHWSPSGWEYKYPADRFWQLVINTSAANMPKAIALSRNRNAGWIYVTNDRLPNPWDKLPPGTYWNNEINLINQ